jgi:hypothetical protein
MEDGINEVEIVCEILVGSLVLADFVDFLAYIHACKMRMDALGLTADPDWVHFAWTDDGKPGLKKFELQVEGVMPQKEAGGEG